MESFWISKHLSCFKEFWGILKNSNTKCLLLKCGARGLICNIPSNNNWKQKNNFYSIDSFVQNVVDPVGAGDALLAYATLSLYSSKSPIIASILGSIAAGLECEFDGNIPISFEMVNEKLINLEKLYKLEG